VIVLDNLSSGKLENLSWRKTGDDLEFIKGDVANELLLRGLLPGCDVVMHQAAVPSVPTSIAQPLETNTQNLDATLRLLVAARDARVKGFLLASSSAIYGDGETVPKHEALPPNPLSPYALQKFAAEKYAQLFHQLYGLETVSFRYFNIFGPRQSFDSPYSGVIARFCTAMLRGQPPTIFGDGKQARDFTYIDNVVAATLLALETGAEKVAGKVLNVACGQSISLLELAAELNRLTGQNLKPVFEPARAGDVRISCADISAAQRELGYAVKVPWQEGLRRTLEFYRAEARST
jgi:UDP-glucose 4-epimerase